MTCELDIQNKIKTRKLSKIISVESETLRWVLVLLLLHNYT